MSNALIIRFRRDMDCLALLDAQRAVLTINTDWWATLDPKQQAAVIKHETDHLDMAEAWVKWAQQNAT